MAFPGDHFASDTASVRRRHTPATESDIETPSNGPQRKNKASHTGLETSKLHTRGILFPLPRRLALRKAFVALTVIFTILTVVFSNAVSQIRNPAFWENKDTVRWNQRARPIIPSSIILPTPLGSIRWENKFDRMILTVDGSVDYGEINFGSSRNNATFARKIRKDDLELLHNERLAFLNKTDSHLSRKLLRNDELQYPRTCRPPAWTWDQFPNCNGFHEIAMEVPFGNTHQDLATQYIGSGYFRDTWLLSSSAPRNDAFVLKTLRGLGSNHDYDLYSLRFVMVRTQIVLSMHIYTCSNSLFCHCRAFQKEAIVMEKLSSSPRIVDMYGYCASSIVAEAMPTDITTQLVPGDKDQYDRGRMKQKDLDKLQTTDVYPLNNFTAIEKLSLALTMAESLADLHGFEGGVIVHGDYHPDQHLLSAKGQLKLNDFNNGEFLHWNDVDERYCYYSRQFGGTYKAPEEFSGGYCNQEVDTWSFGNNIYGLLTGLYPMYETYSHSEVRERFLNHELPYVDPRYRSRSYIEGRLVEIMEKCWAYEPEDRASIFDVVIFLQETLRKHEAEQRELLKKHGAHQQV